MIINALTPTQMHSIVDSTKCLNCGQDVTTHLDKCMLQQVNRHTPDGSVHAGVYPICPSCVQSVTAVDLTEQKSIVEDPFE